MKYMIMLYASQEDFDAMAGKPSGKPAWSGEVALQVLEDVSSAGLLALDTEASRLTDHRPYRIERQSHGS